MSLLHHIHASLVPMSCLGLFTSKYPKAFRDAELFFLATRQARDQSH